MKNMISISIAAALVGLMSLAGCAAPTESVTESESALEQSLADPDLKAAIEAGKTNDVIIVRRSAKTDLVNKLIEAQGKVELAVGKGSPIQGSLEGKFKIDDLKKLVVKDEYYIVILEKGTGAKAAQELFRGDKFKEAVDDAAEKQLDEKKKAADSAPPAPGGME